MAHRLTLALVLSSSAIATNTGASVEHAAADTNAIGNDAAMGGSAGGGRVATLLRQVNLLADENEQLRSELALLSSQQQLESGESLAARAAIAVAQQQEATALRAAEEARAAAAASAAVAAKESAKAELAREGALKAQAMLAAAEAEQLATRSAADALAVARTEAVRAEMLFADELARSREAASAIETRERWLSTASLVFDRSIAGIKDLLSVHLHHFIILLASVVMLREALKIAHGELAAWLRNRPALVRETSIQSTGGRLCSLAMSPLTLLLLPTWRTAAGCCRGCGQQQQQQSRGAADPFRDIILHAETEARVRKLAHTTQYAHAHGSPLRHALFFGPPGSGKTMVARRIAMQCGLDYAMMAGGDVAALSGNGGGVAALLELLQWGHRSKRGLILFIDEAEAFLGSRARLGSGGVNNTAAGDMLPLISTMLAHTGDVLSDNSTLRGSSTSSGGGGGFSGRKGGAASPRLMLIIATNRPEDLDGAVTDRIDDVVYFGEPDSAARRRLGRQYFAAFVASRSQYHGTATAERPLPLTAAATRMLFANANADSGESAQYSAAVATRTGSGGMMGVTPRGRGRAAQIGGSSNSSSSSSNLRSSVSGALRSNEGSFRRINNERDELTRPGASAFVSSRQLESNACSPAVAAALVDHGDPMNSRPSPRIGGDGDEAARNISSSGGSGGSDGGVHVGKAQGDAFASDSTHAYAPAPSSAALSLLRALTGMLSHSTRTHPRSIHVADDVTLEVLDAISTAAEGFSCRQMAKLMLNMQASAYAAASRTGAAVFDGDKYTIVATHHERPRATLDQRLMLAVLNEEQEKLRLRSLKASASVARRGGGNSPGSDWSSTMAMTNRSSLSPILDNS